MRALAPAILADAAEAARARLDAIDREIRPWWDGLSQPERDRTYVLVLGVKTARPGNLAYPYFVNLLGAAEDGQRVVYAEGVFDEEARTAFLATLLTDRRLSVDLSPTSAAWNATSSPMARRRGGPRTLRAEAVRSLAGRARPGSCYGPKLSGEAR